MPLDPKPIYARIEKALLANGVEEPWDIAFHMTDWISDLERLARVYADETTPHAELFDAVMAFLGHVPAHVTAASMLLTGLPTTDVFGIGAVSEEK